MRSLILLLIGTGAALAQPFGFGVKLGLPLTDFINTVQSGNLTANANNNRYIIGITGELRLPFGLGIEGDILYGHFSYQVLGLNAVAVQSGSGSSSAWEFPLLAKYKFPAKIVRPYVDAGVAWDKWSGVTSAINGVVSGTSTSPKDTTMGVVFGGGIDVHVLLIHIAPEIRFTRWTDQHFTPGALLQSKQNQAEFLVGITF